MSAQADIGFTEDPESIPGNGVRNISYNCSGEFNGEGISPKKAHALCCATGERQKYQEVRQAEADKWDADTKQKKAAQAESAAKQERIRNEKQRRVRNKCCSICGQGFPQSFLGQLLNQSNTERPQYDPHLSKNCSVHERCLNKTFQE